MNQSRSIIVAGACVVILAHVPSTFAQITCPGSDPVVIDCNGNGTDDFCDIDAGTSPDADTNGIPDECDATECFNLWSGFEAAPPFATGAYVHGTDTDADGSAWDNPGQFWTVANQGCPAAQGKAIKGVSAIPPVTDFLASEYFRTVDGRLDCGAAIYTLTFDARSEAQLNPRIDCQLMVRDAVHEADVAIIHWASTRSSYPGVTAAQGGNGRGCILVKNPAGSPAFINTGFALSANSCYQLQVVLNNAANTVELSINGLPRVTVGRLQASAARMDGFHMEQAYNYQGSGGVNRLALDNFVLCETGGRSWPDCNADCIDDQYGIAQGMDADCGSNGVPDDCEPECNTNGVGDECDIAEGTSLDCDSNGLPDECQPDCNADGTPDVCDPDCDDDGTSNVCELFDGGSMDCNLNGVPDECETISPCARIVSAGSWRTHGGQVGRDAIPLDIAGRVGLTPVTSESRSGGLTEARIAFDVAPGGPGVTPVSIEQRTCGDAGTYAAYTGAAVTAANIQGNDLIFTFTPALENARTYRITVGSGVTAAPNQSIELRGLVGDTDSSGRVNATDRSTVVSVWTGAGYSPATDIDLSGSTNGADRSVVVSAWTGVENCAP